MGRLGILPMRKF